MTSARTSLSVLRGLLREIRLGNSQAAQPAATKYVLDQFRRHQVTQKQHCKASEEMRHLAESYETYLRGQRLWDQVHGEYHAKGERSVADLARMVGFKLPHEPKVPRTKK